MSWSYSGIGKPAALKNDVKQKFANLKPGLEHIPHEHASAALTEEIIDGQLNFLAEHSPNTVVQISAGGHAYTGGELYPAQTSHNLSIATLGVIVE